MANESTRHHDPWQQSTATPTFAKVDVLKRTAEALRKSTTYDQRYINGGDGDTICQTPGCIAGHIVFVRNSRLGPEVLDRARVYAELTQAEAAALFDTYGSLWPEPYRTRLQMTGYDGHEAALVAADFLDALVEGTVTIDATPLTLE